MKVFATLFARNYAERAIALYRSLEWHCPGFLLYGILMDRDAEILMDRLSLPFFIGVTKEEATTPELREACHDRDLREICWTYAPVACRVALERAFQDRITYVDADTLFFSNPEPVFREIRETHITIVPHRFPERLKGTHEENGKYNVNFVSVQNSSQGRAILSRWERDCTEWCYYRAEMVQGRRRLGDQGYWDDYVREFSVHVINHIGTGVAPWNCENYKVGKGPTVNGVPVIQYHFHEFQRRARGDYLLTHYPISDEQRKYIYNPYVAAIEEAHEITGKVKSG